MGRKPKSKPVQIVDNDNDIIFDTGYCTKCDLSVGCAFIPSRGRGTGNSLALISSSLTLTEYKQGLCTSRKHKILRNLCVEYNFGVYYGVLIKCMAKAVIRDKEVDNCLEHFRKELKLVSPKVIVTVGSLVTSQFIDVYNFKTVVDKPKVIKLNGKDVVIYPIHSPSYSKDITDIYTKSFENIAKLYKAFINPNYTNF